MPGNEGLSEGLRIEINVDPKDAQKGLDSLVETLGKLQGAVDKATGAVQKFNTSQFSGEMKKLSTAMKPLRDFKATADSALSGLNSFIQSANSIGQESDSTGIVDYITGIASAVSLLADAGKQLKKPLESLGSLGTVVQELSSVMEGSELSEGITKLTEALAPLGDVVKGDFDKVLTQLKRFPDIAKGLSDVDLDQFAQKVKQLADALKPLAVELEKVAAGFKSLPKGITSASKAVGGFEAGTRSLGKGLKIAGLAVALRKTSKVMSEWVKTSNDYVENLNLFRVAMGDAADEALDYAEKVQGAFGIDPSEWIRFQSVFQNMVTGFGIAGEKASGMSKTLTQLGYDLSTLFNVDYETAMRKLQSAIAGQPRPMREWGFDLSETTLKLTALRHGIEQNVETMTQYEKSQLRFMQIMDTAQKQGVLGNFAREIYTPANAMRILQQQIVQLKRALGNLLIPMLMKVLPYLQAFVIIVTDAIRALGTLVGFTLPTIDYSGLGGSVGEVGDGLEEIEAGAEGANAAAKKLQSTLLGFDELNIVSEPAASGGGGGGVGVDIGGGSGLDFDLSGYDYDFLGDAKIKALELVEEFRKKIEPVVNFIKNNFDIIKGIIITAGALLLTWKVADAVVSFVQWITGLSAGKQLTLGIALMLGGIALGASGFANIVAGEGALGDWIKTGVGAALGIAGSLIAFGTGPLGWTMAVTTVLTMLLIGLVEGEEIKFANSELGKYLQTVKDNAAALDDFNEETREMLDNFESTRTKIELEQGAVELIAERYLDLAESTGLTNEQKILLKQYADQLIEAVPRLVEVIDEETGALTGTREAVEKLIEEKFNLIKLDAVREQLTEVYKRQFEGQQKLYQAEQDELSLSGLIADKKGEINALRETTIGMTATELRGQHKLGEEIRKLEFELGELEKTYTINQGVMTDTKDVMKRLSGEVDFLEGTFVDLSVQTATTASEVKGHVKGMLDDASTQVRNFKMPKIPIEFDVKAPNISSLGGLTLGKTITAYADGGYPDVGEMFIAREAGPEMVGTIGGRTAVATNADIVDGVAKGVYAAVKAATPKSDGGSSVHEVRVYLDGREISANVEKYQRERGRVMLSGGVV